MKTLITIAISLSTIALGLTGALMIMSGIVSIGALRSMEMDPVWKWVTTLVITGLGILVVFVACYIWRKTKGPWDAMLDRLNQAQSVRQQPRQPWPTSMNKSNPNTSERMHPGWMVLLILAGGIITLFVIPIVGLPGIAAIAIIAMFVSITRYFWKKAK